MSKILNCFFQVQIGAVFKRKRVVVLSFEHVERELRHRVARFVNVIRDKAAVQSYAVEHFSLIHKDDIGVDLILIGKLHDRYDIVIKAVEQQLLNLGKIRGNLRVLVDINAQGQSVNQHAVGVLQLGNMSAVFNGAEQRLLLTALFCESVGKGAEEERILGDFQPSAALGNSGRGQIIAEVERKVRAGNPGRIVDLIGDNIRVCLNAGEHFIVKLFAFLKTLALLELLLVGAEHKAVYFLAVRLLSHINLREIVSEYGGGGTVCDKVMYVVKEIQSVGCNKYLEAEKRPVLKVKRLYKGSTQLVRVGFVGGFDVNPDFHILYGNNARNTVNDLRAHLHKGIQRGGFLYGFRKALRVHTERIWEEHRRGVVVLKALWLLNVCKIYSELGVRHGIGGLFLIFKGNLFAVADARGDRLRCSQRENLSGRQLEISKLLLEHDNLDRIAAEREEIVVHAYPFELQKLFKGGAYLLFAIGDGSLVLAAEIRRVRLPERLAIELSVRSERKFIDLNQKARNHIRRKFLQQALADIRVGNLAVGSEITADICLAVIVGERLNNGGFYALDLAELNLDLAHLNALTVDLHHPVLAVDINHATVGQALADIARMQQPLVGFVHRIGVLGKDLGGQLGKIDIAARHCTRYAQLALFAVGNNSALVVEQQRLKAAQRSADRSVVISLVKLEGHGDAQQLAESVGVFDARVRAVDAADTLAARIDELERAFSHGKLFEHLRTDDRGRDAVLVDIRVDEQNILALLLGENMDLGACPKRSEDIVGRNREVKRRNAHFDIVSRRAYLKLPDNRVCKRPVVVDNTLWIAR